MAKIKRKADDEKKHGEQKHGEQRHNEEKHGEASAENDLLDDEAIAADGSEADLGLSDDSDDEEETEVDAAPRRRAARESSAADESVEAHTVASRQRLREQMAQDIESFLSRGGRIQVIEPDLASDSPRKAASDYGSSPA